MMMHGGHPNPLDDDTSNYRLKLVIKNFAV